MEVGKKLLSWDQSEILKAEVERRLEEDNPDGLSEDQMWPRVAEDPFLIQSEWEYFLEVLDDLLKEKNPDGCWKAEVHGFGWRGLDGHSVFRAESAAGFLKKVLPKCDCTFIIYGYGRGLAINNFHHDSPTGREWYYLIPTTARVVDGEVEYAPIGGKRGS
jgi:hypothetical protein